MGFSTAHIQGFRTRTRRTARPAWPSNGRSAPPVNGCSASLGSSSPGQAMIGGLPAAVASVGRPRGRGMKARPGYRGMRAGRYSNSENPAELMKRLDHVWTIDGGEAGGRRGGAAAAPHPVVADEQDELHRTGKRLGEVESVLRDARADAGAVAAALAAADRAVARSRARLATATAELDRARRRRAEAMMALEAATDEEDRQERRLAEQVRGAYMTGRVTGLAVLVEASDLRDLVERAVTLSYVISADRTP